VNVDRLTGADRAVSAYARALESGGEEIEFPSYAEELIVALCGWQVHYGNRSVADMLEAVRTRVAEGEHEVGAAPARRSLLRQTLENAFPPVAYFDPGDESPEPF
jgi:hypothetical protein